jgi:ribonuclease VapC
MFVDASAIIAILAGEPDAGSLVARIEGHGGLLYISPIVAYEAVLGLARSRGTDQPKAVAIATAKAAVEDLVESLGMVTIDLTPEIGIAAIDAASRYGKAVGHAASLNMGDCFAYAAAKALDVPLLYKGNDFAQTDLA